ncbi:MAG: hypothetical protein WB507_03440, partial [Solirubrobacterales bacterium]
MITDPTLRHKRPIGRAAVRSSASLTRHGHALRAAVALLFAAAALALTPTPALAEIIGHRFETTIAGSGTDALTNPTDVAVDNSAGPSEGDIYVTDPADHRIEKFGPSGEFLLMFGKEVDATTHGNVCPEHAGDTCQPGISSSVPGGFETPTFIAVDGSASASAGDVYVADTAAHLVSKLNPKGEIITSWSSAGQASFPALSGLGADHHGNLFVEAEPSISEYTSTGVEFRSCEPPQPSSPNGIAVDSSENLYEVTTSGKVERFSNECTGALEEDGATGATGLIVNPAEPGQNDLYVDQGGTSIDHFQSGCTLPDCAPADSFGSGHLTAAQGIAIANNGTVYVADTGGGSIAVFPNLIIPELSTNPVNTNLTTATLSGQVDPAGGGEITKCQFEYVDQAEFEATGFSGATAAACSPATPIDSPKEVSAHIAGLTKHTTYHYRLTASNAHATNEGPGHTFTTLPTHVFSHSFGAAGSTPADPYPLVHPNGLAVEEMTGDVYVSDSAHHRIEKFDPAGHFLLMFGKEVNKTKTEEAGTSEAEKNVCTAASGDVCQGGALGTSPGALEAPSYLAVDNTSGPSAGDLYTVDNEGNFESTITKFDSNGEVVSTWGEGGRLHTPSSPDLTGVGVDGGGHVWTATVWPASGGCVFEYSETGVQLKGLLGGCYTAGLAAGPVGETFYANIYNGSFPGYAHFSASGASLGGKLVPGSGLVVAASNLLYTVTDQELSEFNSSGEPLGEPFGFGELSGPAAVGVDSTNEEVYVANETGGNVSAYESIDPGVETGPIENEDHTKVTLTGHLNLLGHGDVTECQFEYVDQAEFEAHEFSGAATVPCSQTLPYSSSTAVSAEVTGLHAEVAYHYRLFAGNENGNVPGAERLLKLLAVFGVTTKPATDIERTSATLTGSLDPDGIATTYHFEYVDQADFEAHEAEFEAHDYPGVLSAPASPAGPISGTTEENVSAPLSGLDPQSAYHYRLVAENADGTTYGHALTLETDTAVLSLKTESATDVFPESATLHGSYTGDPEGGDTQCYFRYGTDTTYGHNTSSPPGIDQGATSEVHEVEVEVTGLSPRHTYHFSFVCHNELSTTAGLDQHFETPEPPTIDGLSSADLTKTTATLKGVVNPQEYETTCSFEYGTSIDYGHTVPCPPAEGLEEGHIGSGSTDVPVEVQLENLQVGFVYHFRLVATNKWGTSSTEDHTFTFYPPHCPNETLRQETNSSFLPDCRAYELVTPGNAGSVVLGPGGVPSSSYAENPTRFAFFGVFGEIPGGESPNYNGDIYIATRTPSGWVTHYVGLRGDEHPAELLNYLSSEDLEDTIDYVRPENEQLQETAPYAWDAEGNPLGQWPRDIHSVSGGESTDGMFQPSPDFSHLAFSSSNVVFPTEHGEGQTTGIGSAYDYDTKTEATELVSVLPTGGSIPPAPGYSPGPETRDTHIVFPSTEREATARNEGSLNGQSVSTDGSHILMGTLGKQQFFTGWVPGYPCTGLFGSCETGPGLMQLYMRIDDAISYCVSCKADGEPAEVEYIGMTPDGSTVYFMSEEQLTPEDHDTSVDLYMWSAKKAERGEPALVLVSKGNTNGAIGNSDDCQAEDAWTPKCGVMAVRTGSLGDKNEEVQYTGTDNYLAENGDIYF